SKVAWALRSLADVTGDHLRTVTLEHLRRGRAPTWGEWRRHLRHVAGVADFVHLAYAKFIQRIQEARSRDE
ncbi:MAG: hypothetical protein K8I02_03785, partial [Candidatus Methylomirabilis sp.]|nr:hypothetical protein [Deltaproteobacteria bacterium]